MFTVVLLAHVATALVGLGAMAATGISAARAARGPSAPGATSVRRYFQPGANIAGRTVYLVPILGSALVAMSQHRYEFSDRFVAFGIVLWLLAVGLAETVVWPGEKEISRAVSGDWDGAASEGGMATICRRVTATSALVVVIFVLGTVVMFAQF